MKKSFCVALLFLLPGIVLAAGFAKDSLFLSKSPVQEGDSVRIYAIVANDSAAAFEGSVVVSDGSTKLGSVPVSMDAGGTQTASIAWEPSAGTHTITAALTAQDGSVVETESAAFSIAAKPAPVSNSNDAVAVGSSAGLQQDIATYSPGAAQATEPFFTTVDGLRANAAGILDSQLAAAKNNLANTPKPGLVLGTTSASALPNPAGSFWFVVWTLYLYILTLLRWLVGNAGVFYPVLALFFFYLLWRTYRAFRRPSY